MGFDVRLISPQYVAPFVKTHRNDANDANAIVVAASRPNMHFVTVKSVEQQDMRAVHYVREPLVHQRTALINQVRGLQAERGVVMAQTPTCMQTISIYKKKLAKGVESIPAPKSAPLFPSNLQLYLTHVKSTIRPVSAVGEWSDQRGFTWHH